MLHAQYFNQIWIFSTEFHENPQYKISPKNRPDTCGRTDRNEKTANMPKNVPAA
jgi:hypothetical protein